MPVKSDYQRFSNIAPAHVFRQLAGSGKRGQRPQSRYYAPMERPISSTSAPAMVKSMLLKVMV